MATTSISLLQRLREHPQADDWSRLVGQYTPMIQRWLRQRGVREHDADEISQDVMSVLVRRISEFERQRTGSFRRWVRLTTVNCMRDHMRKAGKNPKASGGSDMLELIHALADDASQLSARWDEEHARHLVDLILARIEPEFRRNTWLAFRRVAIEGRTAAETAEELKISVNAVFVAKSRVLKRLREEGSGLIDE